MSRGDKKAAQMRHARQRAIERYDIEFDQAMHQTFLRAIQSGDLRKAVKLWRQSNRVSIFKVWFDEKWIPVVYDNQRKQVVTFLPIEALEGLERDSSTNDSEDFEGLEEVLRLDF